VTVGQSKPQGRSAGHVLPRAIFFDRDGDPMPEAYRLDPHSSPEVRSDVRALKRSIESLPDQTALLDPDWCILAVSSAWAREGRTGEVEELVPGDDFRALSARWAVEGQRNADVLLAAVESLSVGRTTSFHHVFEVSDRLEDPRYAVNISSLEVDGRRFFTITRCEVSRINQLAQRCRTLEEQLLLQREDERKRIGRELHDSTSQLLVGLKLCLMRLKEANEPRKTSNIMEEMDEILLDIDQEIRSISFLLHPPRLQGRGLSEAIRYMARGFARRSRLDIHVDVEGVLPARIPEVEAALYRLAQEALANVYRHSSATLVKVRLVARHGSTVHLLIEDNGSGFASAAPRPAEPGVGIESMAARVAELGGRFSFRRLGLGYRLLASIRIPGRASCLAAG
jgi:two-component system, NarL family, sensor kinase